MLKSEINTPIVEAEIMATAELSIRKCHKSLSFDFEHGQWWVQCGECGASWSVVDCQKDGEDYFGFEMIDTGDEYCLRGYAVKLEEDLRKFDNVEFTYYCYHHRDQIKKDRNPSSIFPVIPICPVCNERMFWVTSGGTEIPNPYHHNERSKK